MDRLELECQSVKIEHTRGFEILWITVLGKPHNSCDIIHVTSTILLVLGC